MQVSGFDVFLSYRRTDIASVRPFVQALRERGLRVWMDEGGVETFTSIQKSLEAGLAQSKVLLAWFSALYPTSLACQWELTRAFTLGLAEGDPRRRVLLVNPEPSNSHIHPIELRDALYLVAPGDAAALAAAASAVAKGTGTVSKTFGELGPAGKPRWFGAAAGDGSNRFVGRIPELWAIHSGLHGADLPGIHGSESRPLVVLSGMAGSGKSLTAETYGIRFGAAWPGGVFWLKAYGHDAEHLLSSEDREAVLEDQLLGISMALGLDTEGLHPAQVRQRLAATLATRGPYLWVVDDVPSRMSWTEVQPWLAPSREGRTLMTTRGGPFRWAGTHLALNELDEPSALSLLTHLRKPATPEEEAEARALLHDLGCLALGLELAAVLVQKRGFAAVRSSIAAPSRDVLELAATLLTSQGEQLPHREKTNLSLSATLSLSLEGLPGPAWDFLRLAAELAPAPIPREVAVKALAATDGLDEGSAEDAADLAAAQAAAESLVREPAPGSWLVHTLVSRTVRLRDTGSQERWRQLRRGAVLGLDAILDEDVGDPRRHARLNDAVVHARALLAPAMASNERLDSREGRLLDGLYMYDFVRGNYKEARRIAERLIANAVSVLGPEHEYTLIFRSYLGRLMRMQGELDGALAENLKLYEVRGRVLGPTHPDTLTSLSDVAVVLYTQGELGLARGLQEVVLAARHELLGEQHPDTATAMNNLAITLSKLGEPSTALALEERAVGIRGEVLGPDHPETRSAKANLATMRLLAGHPRGATDVQAHAEESQAAVSASDTPDSLTGLNNLAVALRAQGNLAGARATLERCLRGRVRLLGEDNPDTLTTRNNLAAVLIELEDYPAARTLLEDSLERCQRALGATHPETFSAAFHLLITLVRANDTSGRAREVLARDLAPLVARDPGSLPQELREIRSRLIPLLQPPERRSPE